MSERPDPVDQAIARGSAAAERLIGFRDALFEPMAGILLLGGEDGLRACVAGVAEAVIIANRRRSQGLPPIDSAALIPLPPKVAP